MSIRNYIFFSGAIKLNLTLNNSPPTGSFTLNVGLQYEQAAVVALIRNVDIVIAYVFDVLIFRHDFSAMSLVGGGMIAMATIGSGLVNLLQEAGRYKKVRSCESVEDNFDYKLTEGS